MMVVLQRVAEPKASKNRVHLDVLVDDLDEATARAETLGRRWTEPANTRELHAVRWPWLADPEGNEFCLWVTPPT
jgi:hypothetical protein